MTDPCLVQMNTFVKFYTRNDNKNFKEPYLLTNTSVLGRNTEALHRCHLPRRLSIALSASAPRQQVFSLFHRSLSKFNQTLLLIRASVFSSGCKRKSLFSGQREVKFTLGLSERIAQSLWPDRHLQKLHWSWWSYVGVLQGSTCPQPAVNVSLRGQ